MRLIAFSPVGLCESCTGRDPRLSWKDTIGGNGCPGPVPVRGEGKNGKEAGGLKSFQRMEEVRAWLYFEGNRPKGNERLRSYLIGASEVSS